MYIRFSVCCFDFREDTNKNDTYVFQELDHLLLLMAIKYREKMLATSNNHFIS
jgi:hypothetical protein